jgi:hypothetical protein
MSGNAAAAAQATMMRQPGRRTDRQPIAAPASAWPIGLGIGAGMMADSAYQANRGESRLFRQMPEMSMFLALVAHNYA